MRRFRDQDGRTWDVVVGRESWGAHMALFVPMGGGTVREATLAADDAVAAQQQLDDMDEAGLQRMLETAREKETGR